MSAIKNQAYIVQEFDKGGREVGELHYPDGKIAKHPDKLTDLPPSSVKWLLAAGVIKEA